MPEAQHAQGTAPAGGSLAAPELRRLAMALLLYALLAVLVTWPLARQLSSVVPHDLADPVLNTWILWWNAHAVPFTAEWWSGPVFHPIPGALSFSESLVGLAPLTTPLQWLGASPLTAYNVAFLLSFPLSALSMHLLARGLGLGTGPSLVAGLAFGFAPQRAVHLAQLQILSAYFIPLIFLAAHRYAKAGRRRWLFVFAAAWVLQGLTNGYFLAYVSVLFAAWLAWFVRSLVDRGRAARLVLVWALALAALAPVLVRYSSWHAEYGFERGIQEIESMSANVRGWLAPPPGLAHWPSPGDLPPGSYLFPGITIGVLLLLLVGAAWRRRPVDQGRWALAFAALAASAALVAAATAVTGPWRVSVAGVALSVRALSKPLALACYALVAVVLTSRSLRDAWRRGSVPAFYLLAAAAMFVLALGPNPLAGEVKVWDKAPYYYLLKLPGLSALRAPSRFAMPGLFCLVVAASTALARLVESRRWPGPVIVAIAGLGVLWDGWLAPLPFPPSPVSVTLPAEAAGAAVLELPVGAEQDASAMYRGTGHGLPVINGYSGFAPPHYLALRAGLLRDEPDVLTALREQGPVLVLVDGAAPNAGALRGLVRSGADVRSLGDAGGRSAYLLPAVAAPPPPALGEQVQARLLHASSRRAVFELERPGAIGAVLFHFGAGVSALPAAVTIETGDEGSWVLHWRGPVAGRALRGALRDPRRVPVVCETPGASGRLLRIRVDGPWTIEQVVPLGSSAARAVDARGASR